MASATPLISVVVPAFNEEDNIVSCAERLSETLRTANYRYEIIVVNDGSTDKTLDLAKTLREDPFAVRTIDLGRHYGKAVALWEGMKKARGNLIALFDADLQYDPLDMVKMIRASHNFDVMSGRRDYRTYGLTRTAFSRIYNRIIQLLFRVSIVDSNCGMKILARRIIDGGNPFRFGLPLMIPLLKVEGYTIGEFSVSLRTRVAGQSKFYDDGAFLGGKRNLSDLSYHAAMLLGLLASAPIERRRMGAERRS